MALISTSVVNNVTAQGGSLAISQLSSGSLTSTIPTLTSTGSSAVTSVITGNAGATALTSAASNFSVTAESLAAKTSSSVSSTISGAAGATSALVGSVTSGVTSKVAGVASSIASAGFLTSALSSINSTISGATKALASTVDSALSGIFKNTNVASASNTTTSVSDPTKTNILAKTPVASAFKVSSLQSGSQAISLSGLSSAFGSNAASMVGTALGTLTSRFNLTSGTGLSTGLASSITKSLASGVTSKLLSNPAAVAGAALGAVTSSSSTPSTTAEKELNAQLTGYLIRDIADLTGKSSTATALTGTNTSSYYVQNKTSPLVNLTTGLLMGTSSSTASAPVANAIVNMAVAAGCSALSTTEVGSTSVSGSLFGASVAMAASYGLDDILSQLLGCNAASSSTAQTSLVQAFTEVVGTNIKTSSMILGSVNNKSALNTDGNLSNIISNMNLKSSDLPTVNDVMSQLGTTTPKAYCDATISTDTIPVFDTNKLASSPLEFTDSVFPEKDVSTYLNGSAMSFNTSGFLVA